jgi:hypothetical protein
LLSTENGLLSIQGTIYIDIFVMPA